jgi:phage terminase large subunit GpA-like protein
MGGYGKPLIGKISRNNRHRAMVIPLGVDTAKELIYARLEIEDPGPAYMHFSSECNDEYFKELTAERHITKYSRGFPTKVWVKKEGQRNEALDTEVYALAAFKLLTVNMESLAKELRARSTGKKEEKVSKGKRISHHNPFTGTPRGSDWINSWKL